MIREAADVPEEFNGNGTFHAQVLGAGGNMGTKLLIDATKPIEKPRSDLLFGERFAVVAYPDKETMDRVNRKWKEYGID